MLEIDLDQEEIEILNEVLQSYLSDLRMEIANTDLLDYRKNLKKKKAAIIKVIDHLNIPCVE